MRLPIWDVGFELEMFLTKGSSVFNAAKVAEKALGFSIDQNKPEAGELKLDDGYVLKTDGTPIELQWFKPQNGGTLPERWFEPLNKVKFLQQYQRSHTPYLRSGMFNILDYHGGKDPVNFIDPGHAFASSKTLHNAYTGTQSISMKKEDAVTTMTERTAGLHLHFSVVQELGENAIKRSKHIFMTDTQVPQAKKHTAC